LLTLGDARLSFGQRSGPKTCSTPGEASKGLFQAVKNEDEQALEAILGAGKEVTSSSDEVEDKLERERFGQKYQEMHRLVREPDGATVLYIGAENWPFPIPLMSKTGAWYFDSEAGMQEIVFRRIGENEATAIETCHALVLASRRHESTTTGNDPVTQYAQTLVGDHATNPRNDAPANKEEASGPFHGYYFRMLTEQH